MGGCGTKEDAKASVGKKQQRTAVGDKPVKPGKAGRKLAALRLKDELIPEFPPVQRPERRPRKIESLGVRDLELSIRLMNSVAVVQDLEACIECLMRGADPNILDSEGDGPLHHAIVAPEFHTTRGLAVIRHLATEGILEEAPHALMLAAHASRVRAAALLLSLNCPVLGGEVPAAMSHVSEEDDVESFESAEGQQVLNAIIDRCPEAVNEPDDEHGDTPLTLALINGKPACALILLKRKASTTTPDSAKRLPIHNVMALQESDKSIAVLKALLNEETKDQLDGEGDTPLHWAVYFDRPQAAKMLLRAGCQKAVTNKAGETPYDLAVKHARSKELTQLVKPSGS